MAAPRTTPPASPSPTPQAPAHQDRCRGFQKVQYTYDALGCRGDKETITHATFADDGSSLVAETVLFVYDGWNVIQEHAAAPSTNAPTLRAYLVWGEDLSGRLQGAGGVGGLLARITTSQALYYHYDGNGNPARLTNQANNGGIYRYDAFGNVREATGVLVDYNPWQFSTKYRDEETGFSYYGYRYYDPVTGRWPSRDPIGERGGINLFGFLANDGINHTDVAGMKPAPRLDKPEDRNQQKLGGHPIEDHAWIKMVADYECLFCDVDEKANRIVVLECGPISIFDEQLVMVGDLKLIEPQIAPEVVNAHQHQVDPTLRALGYAEYLLTLRMSQMASEACVARYGDLCTTAILTDSQTSRRRRKDGKDSHLGAWDMDWTPFK